MIFFDGWGLGSRDAARNPFLTVPMPALRELLGGEMPINDNGVSRFPSGMLVPTDATLGVPGLPQSATGQTTLFTGVNAAQAIGEHLGPYPNDALRGILSHDNIFQRLLAFKHRVAFANAYPPIFFERLARNSARRSATSYAAQAAGVRYRNIDDLRMGRAVSAFVTNDRWIAAGADVPPITAYQAGKNLARIAREYDFTLFEYFLTDAAGHRGDPEFTTRVLTEVDQLLSGVLAEMDSDTLLITTSDHGNIEDAFAKGHTLNPVPTLLIGPAAGAIATRIHSLVDLTPAIVEALALAPIEE
jgi:2,3-bisphosphoglycerate-independent phosphoglycerate mutase